MSEPWHRANPALFEKEKREVEEAYPLLHVHVADDTVFVRGTYIVIFEAKELDRYVIEVELAKNHPRSLPIVRETEGRIPRVADRHMHPGTGDACVILPVQRWEVWPIGRPLLGFFNGPLHDFFLGQTHFEATGEWPFGEWGHGEKGIREYLAKLTGVEDPRAIVRYLECLAAKKLKGHWPCPCGGGKQLRVCHLVSIERLSKKIPRNVAKELLEAARRI
jgi:hypothetical protein